MRRAVRIVYWSQAPDGALKLCAKHWRTLRPAAMAGRRWDQMTHEYGGNEPCDECRKEKGDA